MFPFLSNLSSKATEAIYYVQSFHDLLQHVVFAGKPGLDRVVKGQFVITLARSGMKLDEDNWRHCIKRDIHIEQALMVPRPRAARSKGCPFPGCSGAVPAGGSGDNTW